MSDSRERLFAGLRRTKLASGLSFARMEARTPYSRASLERYVNGKLWPSRQAVHAIATACDADPEPLLRLWDRAIEPELDESDGESGALGGPGSAGASRGARSTTAVGPPRSSLVAGTDEDGRATGNRGWVHPVNPSESPTHAPGGLPISRLRKRWLTVAGVVVAVVVGVVAFVALSGSTQAAAPSTGCRDFYADLRVYTVGRMCWANAEVTIDGDLTNPGEPFAATAQVCVSNRPNTCTRKLDLATADTGQTHRYRTTVHLPPGHGTWVRVCLDSYCSDWK